MKNRKNELLNRALLTFFESNEQMLKRDIDLIVNDVSERCICANLKELVTINLQKQGMYSYYADVEFNRIIKSQSTKLLPYNNRPITCDLIIHSRGKKRIDNLVCLEMKKEGFSLDSDIKRLKYLTSHDSNDCCKYVSDYLIGILYCIDCREAQIFLRFFKNGHEINNPFTIDVRDIKNLGGCDDLIATLVEFE